MRSVQSGSTLGWDCVLKVEYFMTSLDVHTDLLQNVKCDHILFLHAERRMQKASVFSREWKISLNRTTFPRQVRFFLDFPEDVDNKSRNIILSAKCDSLGEATETCFCVSEVKRLRKTEQ